MKKILLLTFALALSLNSMASAITVITEDPAVAMQVISKLASKGHHYGWDSRGLHKGFVNGMAPGQAKKNGGECTGTQPICLGGVVCVNGQWDCASNYCPISDYQRVLTDCGGYPLCNTSTGQWYCP